MSALVITPVSLLFFLTIIMGNWLRSEAMMVRVVVSEMSGGGSFMTC